MRAVLEPSPIEESLTADVILEAKELTKAFVYQRRGLMSAAKTFNAVDGVSLTLGQGQTLGIVGESGCGKSTLGRMLAGLMTPSGGNVSFEGNNVNELAAPAWRASRRRVQMIFQDAPGSLDPRLPVFDQVKEPLELHKLGNAEEQRAKTAAILEAVKLGEHHWRSVPSELSGGQQQRVVIARALILEPSLLILDEPVSALDVSIQAQILTLLIEMKDRLGLSMIFISHDLAVMRQIADRVAVMYLGQIVEEGPVDDLFERPLHPYAKSLLSAVPIPDPKARRERLVLQGDPPSPQAPPPGCRFHTRCPKAMEICRAESPALRLYGVQRLAACHFPEAGS